MGRRGRARDSDVVAREEETPLVPLIVVRVRVPTLDVDELARRYCRYFRGDVVFVPTEGLQPPGRRVRFVFSLADERDVITGHGVVLRMRRDTGDPARPPGMDVRYELLDEASRRLVDRMLALRAAARVPPPTPEPPPYVSLGVEARAARGVGRRMVVALAGCALVFAVALTLPRRAPSRPSPSPPLSSSSSSPSRPSPSRPSPSSTLPSPSSSPRGWGPPVATPLLPAAAVRPHPARLVVASTPRGALVRVDGVARGRTPLTVHVAAGAHALTLSHPRYATERLTARAPAALDVTLTRPFATLHVSARAGALVTVDGDAAGRAPLDVVTTAYERHRVDVALGRGAATRHIYLEPPGAALVFGERRVSR